MLVPSARGSWQVPLDLLCPGREDLAHREGKGCDPWPLDACRG